MEHLGQQKERLSERLKQRQEQELGEVEKLAKAVLDELKKDLKKRVNDELNTTVGAIRDGIEGLPQQISDSTDPLREVLEQARSEANTLKLISSVWLKALLVGVCTAVGIGLGSWGVLSWMGSEVQRLNSEISSAKATLAELPTGVTFVHQGGKSYILAPSMGEPFETKSGKMAVEVN
jgi:signal transduction histidine kinase